MHLLPQLYLLSGKRKLKPPNAFWVDSVKLDFRAGKYCSGATTYLHNVFIRENLTFAFMSCRQHEFYLESAWMLFFAKSKLKV